MREIKFRAWDKLHKEMVGGLNPTEKYIHFPALLFPMQYTGLKDKNGKEIFEGDVITFTEVDEDSCVGREETHTGIVKWIEETSQWRFVYPSGQRRELHLVTNFEPVIECKVIGNIYENPELIPNPS